MCTCVLLQAWGPHAATNSGAVHARGQSRSYTPGRLLPPGVSAMFVLTFVSSCYSSVFETYIAPYTRRHLGWTRVDCTYWFSALAVTSLCVSLLCKHVSARGAQDRVVLACLLGALVRDNNNPLVEELVASECCLLCMERVFSSRSLVLPCSRAFFSIYIGLTP